MWAEAARQLLLAVIGLSAGVAAAGGLFSFIVELGVVADFADRTHTGDQILLYENSVALGGILGNVLYIYQIGFAGGPAQVSLGPWVLGIFGIFAGIFVGCLSLIHI